VSATATTGLVAADSIASLTVTTLGGDVTADSSLGDVEVDSSLSGNPTITVGGDYLGSMFFYTDLPGLDLAGEMSGSISAGGGASASIYVDTLSGSLEIGCGVSANDVYGTVEVDRDLYADAGIRVDGVVAEGGSLAVRGSAAGTVAVHDVQGIVDVGGYGPEPTVTRARITVAGSIGSSGKVIVGDLTDPGDANSPLYPLSGGYVTPRGLTCGGLALTIMGRTPAEIPILSHRGRTESRRPAGSVKQ
jgi:hypothetical protein